LAQALNAGEKKGKNLHAGGVCLFAVKKRALQRVLFLQNKITN
jgi:hypothetical protein